MQGKKTRKGKCSIRRTRPTRNTESKTGRSLRPSGSRYEGAGRGGAPRPAYEKKKAVSDAKTGGRGRAPKPPDEESSPDRQISLTDSDSRLMRRSDAHEFRQAYNAQAVVCAEGSQLIVTTGVVVTSADALSFADMILSMEDTTGLPEMVLADTGYASAKAVRALRKKGVDPLVAIGQSCGRRPYDCRPPPEDREPRRITGSGKTVQTTKTDRGASLWNY